MDSNINWTEMWSGFINRILIVWCIVILKIYNFINDNWEYNDAFNYLFSPVIYFKKKLTIHLFGAASEDSLILISGKQSKNRPCHIEIDAPTTHSKKQGCPN